VTAPALAKRGSEALALPPSSSLCVASHSLVHSLLRKRVEGIRIHSAADTVHTRSVALRVHPVLAVVVSVHVCFGWFTTEGLVLSCTPEQGWCMQLVRLRPRSSRHLSADLPMYIVLLWLVCARQGVAN